jgi:hypothetical protein
VFGRATVEQLTATWHRPLQGDDVRVPRRIAALVLLADQHPTSVVAKRMRMSELTDHA